MLWVKWICTDGNVTLAAGYTSRAVCAGSASLLYFITMHLLAYTYGSLSIYLSISGCNSSCLLYSFPFLSFSRLSYALDVYVYLSIYLWLSFFLPILSFLFHCYSMQLYICVCLYICLFLAVTLLGDGCMCVYVCVYGWGREREKMI